MAAPPTGAFVAARIRKTINQFINAGAISRVGARAPEELGVAKGLVFHRLVNAGVLVEATPDHYFLNRDKLAAFEANRRKRVVLSLIILFSIILLISLFG